MIRYIVVLSIAVSIGCTAPTDNQGAIRSTSLSSGSGVNLVGYHHAFEKSLFNPGASISSVSDMGFAKLIGSNGVFATDEVTGWTIATPNGGAPSTLRPPFSQNGDDHNAKVLGYFIKSGVPADQIGNIQAHAAMRGGMSAAGVRMKDQLVGYCSVINRAINGILVAESTASAMFNVDGEVVEESVYWPALPQNVVSDAADFSAMTADSGRLAAYLRQIETGHPGYGRADGQIVIHHGDSTYHGTPFAIVTYDSLPERRKPAVFHFDSTGQRVVLPHELQAGKSTARP